MNDEQKPPMKSSIADILNMNPLVVTTESNKEVSKYDESGAIPEANDTRREEDFLEARDQLKRVMEISVEAAEALKGIADQSQAPTAYEKLGSLLNTAASASKALMELHKIKKTVDKEEVQNPALREQPQNGPSEVHNHLYVGSTAELQRFIEDMNSKKGQSE